MASLRKQNCLFVVGSSAEGASIEVPQAPRGVAYEEGVFSAPREGSEKGLCPIPRNFFEFGIC